MHRFTKINRTYNFENYRFIRINKTYNFIRIHRANGFTNINEMHWVTTINRKQCFIRNFKFNRFTRDPTNRFTHNFRFQRFTRDIKNRFTSNFTFHRFTVDITFLLAESGLKKLQETTLNRFTGYKRIYRFMNYNNINSCRLIIGFRNNR